MCGIQPFQNIRLTSPEQTSEGKELSFQLESKRRLLFSISSLKLTKICKDSMEPKAIPISMNLL